MSYLKADHANSDDDDRGMYDNLMKGLQSLDGKKAPITQRSHITKASEFQSSDTEKLKLDDLLKPLNKESDAQTKLFKQKWKRGQKQTLEKPLDKMQQIRSVREATYNAAAEEVSKWQAVVEDNRVAPTLSFPLAQSSIKVASTRADVASHMPRTALELEIDSLLKGKKFDPSQVGKIDKPVVLTDKELKAQRAMSLAQAKEELELRKKHRRMAADLAAKNKRIKKIKSRNFRRHLKASQRKEAFKTLEKLKETNPDLFMQKAEQLEKARIEERASLKHKGRSKFAKLARRYGKYNDKIKESLDDMRAKGVELLKKQRLDDRPDNDEADDNADAVSDVDMYSDDESSVEAHDDESELGDHSTDQQNPWLSSSGALSADKKTKSDAARNRIKQQIKANKPFIAESQPNPEPEEVLDLDELEKELMDEADRLVEGETTERLITHADVDRFDKEFQAKSSRRNHHTSEAKHTATISIVSKNTKKDKSEDLDPDQVIQIPRTDLSSSASIRVAGEDSSDEEETDRQRLNIAEAFADDDVVAEFKTRRKRKFEEEEAAMVDSVLQPVLPGWGHWSGSGIDPTKRRLSAKERKQKKLEEAKIAAIKAQTEAARNEFHKGVIVNVAALRKQPIAKLQVENPGLLNDRDTFKSRMAHPVGRDFIPTLAHKELTKPRIKTLAGAIIEPMGKDQIIETDKKGYINTVAAAHGIKHKKFVKQYALDVKHKPTLQTFSRQMKI